MSQPHRPAVVLAIALPALLVMAVVALAVVARDTPDDQAPSSPDAPLAVASVPAPAADTPACRSLVDRLPDPLTSTGTGLARRVLLEPKPPGTAAWGPDEDPVTLRCGLDRPPELTSTATLLEVSGVRWLRLGGDGRATWVAVDRPVYVGLTFADRIGTGPLQQVSEAITETLPPQRVQPG